MKFRIVAAAVVLSALAGCASLSEPKLLQPFTKVALVKVTANDKLTYVGEEQKQASLMDMAMNNASNSGQNNAVANRLLEKNDVLVAKGEEALQTALANVAGWSTILRQALLDSAGYKSAPEEGMQGLVALKPVGYKMIKTSEADLASLAKSIDAQALVVASFQFQKNLVMGIGGTGSLGARTGLNVLVYDHTGKLAFAKYYAATSKSTTGVVADVYDPVKFEAVAIEATQMAVDLFAADLAASR